MTARIPLWKNKFGVYGGYALIDAKDRELVQKYKWYLKPDPGYAHLTTRRDGKSYTLLMHRLIMGLDKGDRRQVDHINRNRLDNRRENLRICTPAENGQNRHGESPWLNTYSIHRGVSWHKQRKKWYASCRVDGLLRHVGSFLTEEEAASAVKAFRAAHLPFSEEALG